MKTAEEILIKEARKEGYQDVQDWLINASSYNNEEVIYTAMKEYAKQAIEEQLKLAAEEAKVMRIVKFDGEEVDCIIHDRLYAGDYVGSDYFEAEPKSILNCTRIKLD